MRAAAPGEYSSPDWFPLRGAHRVGCTTGNGCDGGYHGYAAIDFEATRGESVYAAGAGRVTAVRRGGVNCPDDTPPFTCAPEQYANFVEVDHGAGVTTRYLHLDTVDVQVDDEGPGIEAGKIDHVFERYFSSRPEDGVGSDAAGKHSGLGLWIARRNIEALGGQVSAANRAGGGLSIAIVLPRNGAR